MSARRIGLAAASECIPTSVESSVALADGRLYRAYEGGRNRVVAE